MRTYGEKGKEYISWVSDVKLNPPSEINMCKIPNSSIYNIPCKCFYNQVLNANKYSCKCSHNQVLNVNKHSKGLHCKVISYLKQTQYNPPASTRSTQNCIKFKSPIEIKNQGRISCPLNGDPHVCVIP